MARPATRPSGFSSGALTLTVEEVTSSSLHQPSQTLVLRLKPPKKKVTWKEGTVDNEFLGRKSSKKCCIFHKRSPLMMTTVTRRSTVDPIAETSGMSRTEVAALRIATRSIPIESCRSVYLLSHFSFHY
ncbi:hypothetical protein AXF42_Ash019139 [Apostasia shenzhenica]|uniref:Protein phosphatase 1 regulatory subunit 11 n=1 Tax=Apostasia shenzhenica TaxID=1088818 RepID=A0A2I0B2A6_9ASPA|nr:hypothetical protein AXF42_Ash019139 [Apostasia shenzhenica]